MAEIKSSDLPPVRPFPEGTEEWQPEQKAEPQVEPSPDGAKPERFIHPSEQKGPYDPEDLIIHNEAIRLRRAPERYKKLKPRLPR